MPTPLRLAFAVFVVFLTLSARAVSACDGGGCAAEHGVPCAESKGQAADAVPAAGTKDATSTVAPATVQPEAIPSVAAPAAGMRVDIDPKTGAYSERPAAVPPSSASQAGVRPEPVEQPLPGGGTKVDTRHIRHSMKATAGPDGTIRAGCTQSGTSEEVPH
jgi:hypothetical protein